MGKCAELLASFRWTYVCLAIFLLVCGTNAQCTWPSVFDSTTWLDSQQGQIDFTSSTELSGFSVTTYGTTLSTYTCFEETFDTDKIILLRSTTSYVALGANWNIYICLKFTELIPGVAYTYYRLNPQQPDAGEYRTKPKPIVDSPGTIATTCDEAAGSSGAEFVTIIKQGSEASAYITCPSVILGRFEFNYTNSAGTESCNDPSNTEHMNVCTDKTQLAFDDPCSGQSIVYASDSVHCVATLTVGADTYIQLYNPQATVDSSNTYRFSCMAISSDSLSATIVYNNCTNHQTSTYVPRSHDGNVIGASISFSPYVFCQGGCTWPAAFVSSTWRDNTRGDITFGTDTLTGWSVSVQGTTVDQWECLDQSDFDTEGILIIKSTETFEHVGGTWTTFVCFEMTKVTDYSYYYYQKHDQIDSGSGGNERGFFNTDGTITGKSNICGTNAVPAPEFHFMLKSGSEVASKQYCSPSLLAKMDYTHTDDQGAETCQDTIDDWDVCTDRTVMTFNYTSCSTEMAYSSGGQVYCMVNLTSTYEYTVVYNTDASPTYRFACIVSNSAGAAASVVYNNCTIGQTPTSYALLHDGSNIGYLVTMTPKETCPFLGPTTPSTVAPSTAASTSSGGGGSIIPIIVGAVVGVLAILIAIAIVIYYVKFKNTMIQKKKDYQVQFATFGASLLSKDPRNGHIETINVEDMDANPALTIQPLERNTLTPLPPKPDTNVTSPPVLPPIANHV